MRPTIILIDKPVGPSSFDVIRKLKKTLKLKRKDKIGHFGTLDPFASGLMIIGLFGASRLADYCHEFLMKTYHATGELGVHSLTGDNTCDEFEYLDFCEYSIDNLKNSISSFEGEYWQSPSSFSASKHEGKKLYEYAREGIMIEKPPVKREIKSIVFDSCTDRKVSFSATVSTGTFIRVLFQDIAKKLNTTGALSELRRTKIGSISVDRAIKLDNVDENCLDLNISMTEILPFNSYRVSIEEILQIKNGSQITVDSCKIVKNSELPTDLLWLLDSEGEVLCLAHEIEPNIFRPKVNFSV